MRRRYSGALIAGTGPISATLPPPRVGLPLGPSVKSQTLPETSAASDVSAAAACASASVGKVSTCQYNGPAGSRSSFFSATGLTKNACCAAADDGDSNTPIAHSDRAKTTTRRTAEIRSFIVLLLALACAKPCCPHHARRRASALSVRLYLLLGFPPFFLWGRCAT